MGGGKDIAPGVCGSFQKDKTPNKRSSLGEGEKLAIGTGTTVAATDARL